MAALYTVLKCKRCQKAVNTVSVSQAMQPYDRVPKQDHNSPHGGVFSLKDKDVRVSPSTSTGKHLTSTLSYINVGVSTLYMFICHNILTVILGIFVVI